MINRSVTNKPSPRLSIFGGQERSVSPFIQIFLFFSHIFFSIFPNFIPHFGPPGGQLDHPERPWLHHPWPSKMHLKSIKFNFHLSDLLHTPFCTATLYLIQHNTPHWNWSMGFKAFPKGSWKIATSNSKEIICFVWLYLFWEFWLIKLEHWWDQSALYPVQIK